MKDWSVIPGRRWLCDTCGIPLYYSELCQVASSGALMCADCWVDWGKPSANMSTTPLLCGECGRGMGALEHLTARANIMGDGRYCGSCLADVSSIDVEDAIGGLLTILKDTDEEGR